MQEGLRNRSQPAEPNRTEAFDFGTGRNRTRNRTEPDRATTRLKNAGRTSSNRGNAFSEPNRTDKFLKSPEPSRTEPNRFLPGNRASADVHMYVCIYLSIYLYTYIYIYKYRYEQ